MHSGVKGQQEKDVLLGDVDQLRHVWEGFSVADVELVLMVRRI